MRKLVGMFMVGTFLVGAPGLAAADDDGPNFTIGASTSFGFDINEPNTGNPAVGQNALFYSSMEQDESFNLDLVQIGINGQRGALSYEATVDVGDLAAFAGDSADGDIAVQTARITYDFDGVAATVGRFATPIGYEVLEPWGNANISRSRGWIAQPINHDGMTISGSADVVDLMVGVVNSFTVADPAGNDLDTDLGVVASIGAGLSDEFSIYVSGIFTEDDPDGGGPSDSTDIILANLILSGTVGAGNSDIRYALEGNWRENDPAVGNATEMINAALYFGSDLGRLGLDARVDWTDDEGITTPLDTTVWSVTVTGSVALTSGVDFRVEYRHDDADDEIYGDEGSTEDALDLVQAQLVWHPEAD